MRFWQCLGVLILFAMMAMPAAAQNDVVVSPSSLAIAGIQGDNSTVRILTLSVAENVTVSSITPTGLVRDDNAYSISPSAINVTVPTEALEAEGVGNVPVAIQLGGIHSGTYAGNLVVAYRGEAETRENLQVPVKVTVKDRWLVPAGVLGIGVLIGVGIFSYSGKGKRRDELRTQFERLKIQIEGDKEFLALDPALFFRTSIDGNLNRMKILISVPNLDEAENAIKGAYQTWGQWLTYKGRILRQFDERASVQQDIRNLGDALKPREFQYIQTLEGNLVVISYDLLKAKTFEEFETAFAKFTEDLRKERSSYKKLTDLHKQMLEVDKKSRDRETVKTLWKRLMTIGPDDPTLQALENAIKEASVMDAHGPVPSEPGVPVPPGTPALPPAPAAEKGAIGKLWDWVKKMLGKGVSWAEVRLGIFGFISFLLLLVILLIVGYQQLYLANPTFGAGQADYFALFLWGLGVGPGSEATVKSVREQFVV
ncbi:MAG: hypothetical protein LUO91_05555 [Methanomicrobiales archaeon]|nr:hypothetical protein [Methanomicrobiales archaeon]